MTSVAYAAVWLFVFALPWENSVVIPGLGTISRLLGMVAVVLALVAAMVSGRLRRWHSFHVAALLFVLWAGGGLLTMLTPAIPKSFLTLVQLFLVVMMIWELAPTRSRQMGLLMAYVLGAYVAAFNTIVVYRTAAGAARRFAAGGFDPNDLAMTLALALPMAWYLGMTFRQPLLRWICRGYMPLGLIALGLTGSRGGMLASMVALIIVPLTMTRLSPGRLAVGVLLLVLSGALAVAYVPETALQRLASTRTELATGGLNGRFRIWMAGLEAFTLKPLAGYGAGGFEPAVRMVMGHARAPHNSFLSVLVEQGLVGFSFYGMMFVTVFLALLNLPTLERRFGLVLLATLVIAMLPLTWADRKPVWFILAALLGLAQAHMAGVGGAVEQPGQRRPVPITGPPAGRRVRGPLTVPLRSPGRDVRP